MAILDGLKGLFTAAPVPAPHTTDPGPLVLEWDGEHLYQIAGKSVDGADGSQWPRRTSGASRDLPASEPGYAQAYCTIVWVQRAADIRANKIGELLHQGRVVRKSDGADVPDHPFTLALERSRREYHQDIYRVWEYWRILAGEAFIEPVQGVIPGLEMFRSLFGFRVLNALVTNPVIMGGQVTGFDYSGADHYRRYGPDELIYDYTFNPFDDNRGKSMLSAALDYMNIERGVAIATKTYVRRGMTPRVVFTAKNGVITQPQMDELLASIKEQAVGPENAGRPLFLPNSLEATVLTPPPPMEQQKYKLDAQQAAATATGVPLPLIVYEQNPYQLSAEQRIGWYDNSLFPEAQDMAYMVDTHLLPYFDSDPDHTFQLPLDDIRANLIDPKERAEMVKTKLHGGWMTFNQALQTEGRQPIDGGDFYLFPSGVVAVPESQLSQVNNLTRPALPMSLQAVPQPAAPTPPPQLPAGQAARSFTPDVIHAPDDLSITPLALSELAAWQKFYRNGTKRAFVPYLLRDDLADSLRAALDSAGDDTDAIKAAFEQARAEASIKAIQSTRLDFEGEFETLLQAGRAGDLDRRNFSARLRTLLRRYGERAYRDGLTDGGVVLEPGESLSDEDAGNLAVKLAQQSQYVSDFGATLFKGDGLTDVQAGAKPAQWFNGSIMPLYHDGLLSADRNAMMECVGILTDDSCATCRAAQGQRHRFKSWARLDLLFPYGGSIECSDGKQCHHRLQRVNSPARGNLSGIPKRSLEVH